MKYENQNTLSIKYVHQNKKPLTLSFQQEGVLIITYKNAMKATFKCFCAKLLILIESIKYTNYMLLNNKNMFLNSLNPLKTLIKIK